MNELKQTLKKLHELQYVNPITTMFDIEGLGEREFTTTQTIVSESHLDEGIVYIESIYGKKEDPTALLVLKVDLFSREIYSIKLQGVDPRLVQKEIDLFN